MILKGCVVIFCLVFINLFARRKITENKANSYSSKDLSKISFVFSSLLTILTLAMIAIGAEFAGLIQSVGLFVIYWSNIYGLLKMWKNTKCD
ncbi:hypothetical protein [Pseudoalteromonas sp. S558]|uniref:hypothetical protein n=1 Tax=Pseudoalteromonas sp. S558 TaxID=2066515 RepID=UPI00110A2359|nr:hypothetical protein [Pseudoalteromonas sp. S558]TMN95634.1 hypothetical protein CWB66_18320 [Pseudoalteromonas sp. S558]